MQQGLAAEQAAPRKAPLSRALPPGAGGQKADCPAPDGNATGRRRPAEGTIAARTSLRHSLHQVGHRAARRPAHRAAQNGGDFLKRGRRASGRLRTQRALLPRRSAAARAVAEQRHGSRGGSLGRGASGKEGQVADPVRPLEARGGAAGARAAGGAVSTSASPAPMSEIHSASETHRAVAQKGDFLRDGIPTPGLVRRQDLTHPAFRSRVLPDRSVSILPGPVRDALPIAA